MPEEKKWINRPDCPRAHSYEIFSCGGSECGPHIILFDEDEEPICEMVLAPHACEDFVSDLKSFMMDKRETARRRAN